MQLPFFSLARSTPASWQLATLAKFTISRVQVLWASEPILWWEKVWNQNDTSGRVVQRVVIRAIY